ncbi:Leucine-rich repeat and calponin-likey domain-containing protein 2, partial [Ophiophagus hannah]
REFSAAAAYDLSDTTQADLSRNRFTEIPPDVWQFAPLETLNLYHNCIKSIPEAIKNLQMLTYLNISRNLLSTLPKYLFDLPLKVLVVSNNKLVSIPEEIGKLKDLMELVQLGELPLVKLDFSCNKVTEIPVCFRKLRHLQVIVLDNNPMQIPPAQVCRSPFSSIQKCKGDLQLHPSVSCSVEKGFWDPLGPIIRWKPLAYQMLLRGSVAGEGPVSVSGAPEGLFPGTAKAPRHIKGNEGIPEVNLSDSNSVFVSLMSLSQQICLKGKVHIFKFLSVQACLRMDKKPDSLDLPSLGRRVPSQPLTDSIEDFYPNKNHGPDSGIGSDNGDKRLSTTETPMCAITWIPAQKTWLRVTKERPRLDHPSRTLRNVESQLRSRRRGTHVKIGERRRGGSLTALAEEDDDLKEVTDLRKIAAQLLQQEQKNSLAVKTIFAFSCLNRVPLSSFSLPLTLLTALLSLFTAPFLHLGVRGARIQTEALKLQSFLQRKAFPEDQGGRTCLKTPESLHPNKHKKPTKTDCGHRKKSLESQKGHLDGPRWPDVQPVIWQNEERRRSKQIRREYFKYKSSRKSSSGNENDEQDSDHANVSPQSPVSSEERLCLPHHILEERGLVKVGLTVQALLEIPSSKASQLSCL